ncbi:uncharacterized protein TNCT_41861 [Trichonephila clavata]|uniref:Uncharacterized protein n=1 Tax=Trichonephila clavata TaxID=2740835 RepID=A0A8X6M2I9_TRICU|nr:uncharacterized protein TNCT_41861 [Trichonephila clavata]
MHLDQKACESYYLSQVQSGGGPYFHGVTSLPVKEAFYNALTNSHITNDEYTFAQLIFRSFRCKTFGDYLKLYQQLDVILLAEVFTSFRQKCMAYYNLDPCHFITVADLTWNA